jgi:proteic killer suppression protein
MRADFKDENLRSVEVNLKADCGRGQAITKLFRRRMQSIRAALDERDFYVQKSFHFEKLQGDREGLRSMKLNDQWRLILEIAGEAPDKTVWIIGIEDYH